MKNVTISLDPVTAAWARREAAVAGSSLSRWVGEQLRLRHRELDRYEDAMRAWLRRRPKVISGQGSFVAREVLHDRTGLR